MDQKMKLDRFSFSLLIPDAFHPTTGNVHFSSRMFTIVATTCLFFFWRFCYSHHKIAKVPRAKQNPRRKHLPTRERGNFAPQHTRHRHVASTSLLQCPCPWSSLSRCFCLFLSLCLLSFPFSLSHPRYFFLPSSLLSLCVVARLSLVWLLSAFVSLSFSVVGVFFPYCVFVVWCVVFLRTACCALFTPSSPFFFSSRLPLIARMSVLLLFPSFLPLRHSFFCPCDFVTLHHSRLDSWQWLFGSRSRCKVKSWSEGNHESNSWSWRPSRKRTRTRTV